MPFDAPHIHLMINHFPIILGVVGCVAAIVALATGRRGAWMYAVVTLTLAAITVVPVHLTGDSAADVMKDKWYVVRESIERHDEMSGFTMWVMLIAGVASAYAWWRMARRGDVAPSPMWLRVFLVVAALAGTGLGAYTAYLGGEIVYGSPRLITAPTTGPAASPAGGPAAATPSPGAVRP
jgi:uncharacterized membrane protein